MLLLNFFNQNTYKYNWNILKKAKIFLFFSLIQYFSTILAVINEDIFLHNLNIIILFQGELNIHVSINIMKISGKKRQTILFKQVYIVS